MCTKFFFFTDFKVFLLNSTILPLYIQSCPMYLNSLHKLEKTETATLEKCLCVATLALQHTPWKELKSS